MPLKEVITNYWRASEKESWQAIKEDYIKNLNSIICFRRNPSIWWDQMSKDHGDKIDFIHFPIPPSSNSKCSERIQEFIEKVLPNTRLPILFFCKEGKNRTGMISALIKHLDSECFDDALIEYSHEAKDYFRENEVELIKNLSRIICREKSGFILKK